MGNCPSGHVPDSSGFTVHPEGWVYKNEFYSELTTSIQEAWDGQHESIVQSLYTGWEGFADKLLVLSEAENGDH